MIDRHFPRWRDSIQGKCRFDRDGATHGYNSYTCVSSAAYSFATSLQRQNTVLVARERRFHRRLQIARRTVGYWRDNDYSGGSYYPGEAPYHRRGNRHNRRVRSHEQHHEDSRVVPNTATTVEENTSMSVDLAFEEKMSNLAIMSEDTTESPDEKPPASTVITIVDNDNVEDYMDWCTEE